MGGIGRGHCESLGSDQVFGNHGVDNIDKVERGPRVRRWQASQTSTLYLLMPRVGKARTEEQGSLEDLTVG